jgi:outer membrane receptor protein involved in Fe transport
MTRKSTVLFVTSFASLSLMAAANAQDTTIGAAADTQGAARTTASATTATSSSTAAPTSPAPATQTSPAATTPTTSADSLDEIVVNGIRRGELILPTTVTSTAAFGLDLGVMDTPRNNTVLSHAQLDALNVQNPEGFSYLTSSSYTDASFGVPNVPRIRGQYGDMFFNGMRDSFTSNGYGAPVSFNSVDTIDIVKGPASVQAGPGQGVGGAIDVTTKLPAFTKFAGSADLQVDSQQKRRLNLDVGGPLSPDVALRVSYTGDYSGSYYDGMYFHQQALYAVLLAQVTSKYTVQFNTEVADSRYRENDGVNRVNQELIDDGAYLTGGPIAPVISLLTPEVFGNPTSLNQRIIIDEAPGTGAHSLKWNAQAIQTYQFNDNFSVVNNTFYNYLNRYNIVEYYFADTAKGSYTIENKTDFKVKFATGSLNHEIDAGFTYRYAHVEEIQNFLNDTVSVNDLTGDPNTWVFPPSEQAAGGAYLFNAAFGKLEYGIPARNPYAENGTILSNLQDGALFLEHRIEISPQWSVLYGLRGDVVQLNEADPLGGPGLLFGLPQTQSTGWYGLHNGNVSLVFRPTPHVSTYLTYNDAQYVNPNSNDGAVGTFGVSAASTLRQDTHLAEAGVKFDVLDKRLFVSAAVFKQSRAVPTGPGNTESSFAHIYGFETELNYQPDPHFFATASYSYLHTTLDTPASFYDYPAQPGLNYDGAGVLAVFAPGQKFLDPGVPQHLFNVLANYKHESGFGVQANLQVTGPIQTTTSGYLDLAESADVPASIVANGGYYRSPEIPWQYTLNAALLYEYGNYRFKFAVYNLTDRNNLINDYPYYGNDFLTRVPPRSFFLGVTAKL